MPAPRSLTVVALVALALLLPMAPAAAEGTGPSVTVTPSTDLDPGGQTVTVEGRGFGGALSGVYVRLCAEAPGELGTPEGRPGADRCEGSAQHWVANSPGATAPMGADGSFTVELDVVGVFEGSEGELFDCRSVPCGVATRRDHVGGSSDHTLDTFTPVSFRAGGSDGEPAEPPAAAPAPENPAAEAGALDWGVKRSFRSYVEGSAARGEIATIDPAERNPDGSFRFAPGGEHRYDGPRSASAPFAGGVRFTGHDGKLDLTLADPRVEIDGDTGTLTVDARSNDPDTGLPRTFDDIVLATLDTSGTQATAAGDQVTWSDVPATLTEEGAEAFGGFYEAGEALDPLTMVLAVDEAGDLPAATPDPDPEDGIVGCVADTVVGGPVRACATGFLAGEQVQVFVHSEPRFLAVVTADGDGAVDVDVTLPGDLEPGTHRLELRGVSSGRSLMSAPFTARADTTGSGARRLPDTGGGGTGTLALGTLLAIVALGARRRLSA